VYQIIDTCFAPKIEKLISQEPIEILPQNLVGFHISLIPSFGAILVKI
jgi:hypothetical protein